MSEIDIEIVCQIAKKAGEAILAVYQGDDFEVLKKDDDSPVTVADRVSNAVIERELLKAYPKIPIVSEEGENVEYQIRKDFEYFWLIEPLDGTKEFISKNGEFTVNIALIRNGEPILGVVYAPVLDRLYYAKKGFGAYLSKDGEIKKLPFHSNTEKCVIVASKSHNSPDTQAFIESIKTSRKKEFIAMGSSLKLCLVAEGTADIYPRLAPTMEWDIAAAHAVCLESGAKVVSYVDSTTITYNRCSQLNDWFLCIGKNWT